MFDNLFSTKYKYSYFNQTYYIMTKPHGKWVNIILRHFLLEYSGNITTDARSWDSVPLLSHDCRGILYDAQYQVP